MECSECGGRVIDSNGESFCEECGLKEGENASHDFESKSFQSFSDRGVSDSKLSEGLNEVENISKKIGQSRQVENTAQALLRLVIEHDVLPDEESSVLAVVCSNISVEVSGGDSTRTDLVKASNTHIKVKTLESLSDEVIDQLGLEV